MAVCNESLEEQSVCLDSSSRSSITESSQNIEDIFDSPDKFLNSDSVSFDDILEHEELFSEEKVEEFKTLLNKVNDAYVNSKMNEFILDTIKTKCTSWRPFIEATTKSFEIEQNIQLRGQNNEFFNLLGLEEEDIKTLTNTPLHSASKSAFHDHAIEVLRANVARLKLQKKSLQDEFGVHSMKAMDGMMTKERKKQAELYSQVEELQTEARQLLTSNSSKAQEVVSLRQDSERLLQAATFNLIKNKASYLQTTMSIQKEKMDQSLLMDEDTRLQMDVEGDRLKTRLSEMRDELKTLQKKLAEYESKEAASKEYKDAVEEFGKLKMQLNHKQQTLKMLNDPNWNQ